jgi:hypothetical protein
MYSLFTQVKQNADDVVVVSNDIKINTSDTLNKYLKLMNRVYTKSIFFGYIRHTSKLKDTGSYIIIINSQTTSGPSAIYTISRSNKLSPGNINKLAFSEGINGDFVELIWNPGEFPLIKYHYKSVYNSEETKLQKISFLIKII